MKQINKDGWDLTFRKALFLRYGVDQPNKEKPPKHLLSWRLVSQLLGQPYHRLIMGQRAYFKKDGKLRSSKQLDKSKVTAANLTVDEFKYLTAAETL